MRRFRQGQGRHYNRPQINGEEEASLYDTQYNEESILINKVNEMQIKTSRFDQHQHNSHRERVFDDSNLLMNRPAGHSQSFHHTGSMPHRNQNYLNEDFIPNEEPLINVREFWGQNQQ